MNLSYKGVILSTGSFFIFHSVNQKRFSHKYGIFLNLKINEDVNKFRKLSKLGLNLIKIPLLI